MAAHRARLAAQTVPNALPKDNSTKKDSPDKSLGLTGTMRLPGSPLLAPLLIITLLISLTAAAWTETWAGSVVLWTLSGAIALIVFAVLLRDDD